MTEIEPTFAAASSRRRVAGMPAAAAAATTTRKTRSRAGTADVPAPAAASSHRPAPAWGQLVATQQGQQPQQQRQKYTSQQLAQSLPASTSTPSRQQQQQHWHRPEQWQAHPADPAYPLPAASTPLRSSTKRKSSDHTSQLSRSTRRRSSNGIISADHEAQAHAEPSFYFDAQQLNQQQQPCQSTPTRKPSSGLFMSLPASHAHNVGISTNSNGSVASHNTRDAHAHMPASAPSFADFDFSTPSTNSEFSTYLPPSALASTMLQQHSQTGTLDQSSSTALFPFSAPPHLGGIAADGFSSGLPSEYLNLNSPFPPTSAFPFAPSSRHTLDYSNITPPRQAVASLVAGLPTLLEQCTPTSARTDANGHAQSMETHAEPQEQDRNMALFASQVRRQAEKLSLDDDGEDQCAPPSPTKARTGGPTGTVASFVSRLPLFCDRQQRTRLCPGQGPAADVL